MSQFENGSIKSLGKKRKEVLDVMRGLGDYKTLVDLKNVLEAFDDDKLDILEEFLKGGGWSDEISKENLETLKNEIARKRSTLSTLLVKAAKEEVNPNEYLGTPLTGAETIERQEKPESKPEPVVVAGPSHRQRRTPRSPSRVQVARYADRPSEGRRF
ncbi:MAG: hypothetical protein PHU71_01950 [Candidatus Gracilibacteria bacterium]|nr:hypothetical protein [Candidatus Gracilibacteria bacterium]